MDIEQDELMAHLQGSWKLDNDDSLEIIKDKITVVSGSSTTRSSFELVKNRQIGNWQIKTIKPLSWLRSFIVQMTDDTFTVYDFDPAVNIAIAQRTRLLNPSHVYKYTRVTS